MFNQQNTSRVRLREFDPTHGLDRGANKFKETLWYFVKTVFFLSSVPFPSSVKTFILRAFGATVGERIVLKPRINIHMPWKLEIGNDVWIGEEVFILNFEKTLIGHNVCISQRALLCGGNHDYKIPSMPYRNAEIILKDGCWVGASCFVGPGVTIGTDTVVSAGSVVTSSLEGNCIYKGNPAVFVKNRWN